MVNQLTGIYNSLQKEMEAKLNIATSVDHPNHKGSEVEAGWLEWMRTYLPTRYSVTTGKVIDCRGNTSDQIDIIVYDRIFSPPVIERSDFSYVPAESVYAVFEVKQTLDLDNIKYSMKKAESVRRLIRTNANVRHVDGVSKTELKHIIAGILARKKNMKIDSDKFTSMIIDADDWSILDFGCSADGYGFERIDNKIEPFQDNNSLVRFLYSFLTKLQGTGSVPAIDYKEYLKNL